MLLTDAKTNGYGISRRPSAGVWIALATGRLQSQTGTTCSITFPRHHQLRHEGRMQKAPVSVRGLLGDADLKDKGWDIDYIIDQSLKWHISSFNAKSSAVPAEWKRSGPVAQENGLSLRTP